MADQKQIDVVAELHRTFSDRDVDTFVSNLTDDCLIRPSAFITGRTEYRGIDDVRKGFGEIAALVAEGRTNRQVADALFISPRTVEWNLSKIYRKLRVRSRSELAARLARQVPDRAGSIPGEPPGPR